MEQEVGGTVVRHERKYDTPEIARIRQIIGVHPDEFEDIDHAVVGQLLLQGDHIE